MLLRTAIQVLALLVALSARAGELKLGNGDILNGEIVESTEEYVLLEHPSLGQVRIERQHILPEEPPAPEEPPEPEKPGLFGTRFMEGWTRELALGINGAEGNTVNANLTGGFDLKADDDRRRWIWSGRYIFKSEDGSTTDSNGRLQTQYDWLLPESRWFAFLYPTYDYDKFKSWVHRVDVAVGPGYEIVRSEPLDFTTRVGVSGQKEFQGEKLARFAGFWGLSLEWRLRENNTLSVRNRLQPFLVNTLGEFRNVTNVNWKLRLLERPILNLNLGLENEYDTSAAPEDKENDLKYFATLGMEF